MDGGLGLPPFLLRHPSGKNRPFRRTQSVNILVGTPYLNLSNENVVRFLSRSTTSMLVLILRRGQEVSIQFSCLSLSVLC